MDHEREGEEGGGVMGDDSVICCAYHDRPWNVGRIHMLHTPTAGQDLTRSLFPLAPKRTFCSSCGIPVEPKSGNGALLCIGCATDTKGSTR
jgi:hypothetical protein